MSVVDHGDYTVITTVGPNGKTEQVQFKPGTAGANQQTLLAAAQAAITNNVAFLAIPAPTQAQGLAQIQALTRQVDALIRFALNMFDATT